MNKKEIQSQKLPKPYPNFEEFADDELVGTIEILDEDLEGASREIAEMFNNALEKSAQKLVSEAKEPNEELKQ